MRAARKPLTQHHHAVLTIAEVRGRAPTTGVLGDALRELLLGGQVLVVTDSLHVPAASWWDLREETSTRLRGREALEAVDARDASLTLGDEKSMLTPASGSHHAVVELTDSGVSALVEHRDALAANDAARRLS